jgi:adenosine kinase
MALLGLRPRIMATVGRDFSEYRCWLEMHGVDTSSVIEFPEEFTGSFFVSTDLAHNQIASFYTGAMSRASTLSFKDQPREDIDLVIISPNDPRAMVQYARECRELNIPYIYDPSQQIIRLSGEELIEGTRGADMLIVNEYEYEMIKGKTRLGDEEIARLTPTVIITRGERGSTIITGERIIDIPPAPPRRVVEPTGVGDAYRAGIIAGLVHRFPWEMVGRLGSLAATYALEHPGTQNHSFTLEEFICRYQETFGEAPELAGWLDRLALHQRTAQTTSSASGPKHKNTLR